MSVQTLYEVHTLKGGSWVVDSTYPDRENAVEVAKALHGEKRFEAIKVIKDTYDANSGTGKEIVVFDTTSKVNRDKPAAPEQETAAPASPGPRGAAAGTRRPAQPRSSRGKNTGGDYAMAVKVSIWLVLILVGGLGALYILHFAGGMFQRWF